MYDRGVIKRKLEEASRRLKWEPVYHSIADVEDANEGFRYLFDEDTKQFRREFTPDEIRWIQNERRLCALDFHYWLSRYAKIIGWDGKVTRFVPNVAQSIILDIWAEMEREGLAIMMLELKARQLGVTTLTELAVAHRTQFVSRTNAVVASSDPDKTFKMASKVKFCWDKQPFWLLPKITKISKGIPVEFGELNSGILFQAGNQFNGVARGDTPNCVHLSEVCIAPNTLIHTGGGILKPISEVVEGDRVITHTGKLASVKKRWLSSRTNELTAEIWPWGAFAPMVSTIDHPVLTPDGWKSAGSIRSGDKVRHPIRKITSELTEFSYVRRSSGQPFQQKATIITKPLSREWGFLFGLFLAEGCLQTNQRLVDPVKRRTAVVFTGDKDEVATRIERLGQALGYDQHIGVRSSRTSRTRSLYVSNSGLARWIYEQFGEKDEKRVPDWAWSAGRDFCTGIVDGYLHGDGHYVKDCNEIMATSVRVQLPIQIRDLIASLGFGWSAITFKNAGVYYERNCRSAWVLHANGEVGANIRQAVGRPVSSSSCAKHWNWSEDKSAIDIEVYQVADGFSETFYDLEVDDEDHSFTTAQCAVHNCEWPDAADQIDSALLRAIHETPDVFVILESTALGRGDWWHETYKQAKIDWPLGRSRLCPVFLPWFAGVEIYPSDTDLRSRPIPKGWKPSELTAKHARRAYEYVMSNPLMFKHLAKGDTAWKMPVEQMWYYEIERDTAIKKKQLNKFLSEMPADDHEAFQSTNISAIDSITTLQYRESVREPHEVYAITGPGIPPALVPPKREWVTDDPNRPVVRITCANVARGATEIYKLIPIKFEGYNGWDPFLKLLVWEPPQEGETYGVGVDTSQGVGQDNSVVEVLKSAGPRNYDTQVAEFASPNVKAQQLWPMALAISAYYSVWEERSGRVKQCRVAIECMGNGESVQLEMQKRGWSNFHLWKRYDNKIQTKDDAVHKIGIYTNSWFRAQMMDMMLTQFEEQTLIINSPYFVDEMESIERDEKRQSLKAAYGEHDDRFMALGFPLFSLHVEDRPQQQFARRNVKYVEEHMEAKVYPTWQPGMQERDTPKRHAQQVFITRSGAPDLSRYVNPGMPRRFR